MLNRIHDVVNYWLLELPGTSNKANVGYCTVWAKHFFRFTKRVRGLREQKITFYCNNHFYTELN